MQIISACMLRTVSCGSDGLFSRLEKAYGIYVDLIVILIQVLNQRPGVLARRRKHWGVCRKSYGEEFLKASLRSGSIGICT